MPPKSSKYNGGPKQGKGQLFSNEKPVEMEAGGWCVTFIIKYIILKHVIINNWYFHWIWEFTYKKK